MKRVPVWVKTAICTCTILGCAGTSSQGNSRKSKSATNYISGDDTSIMVFLDPMDFHYEPKTLLLAKDAPDPGENIDLRGEETKIANDDFSINDDATLKLSAAVTTEINVQKALAENETAVICQEQSDKESLTVSKIEFTREISNRQPVNPSTRFKANKKGRIYAFLEVVNNDKSETTVTVHWLDRNGKRQDQLSTQLKIGDAKRWRTWTYTSALKQAGSYGVEIETQDGDIIARRRFVIQSAS